MAVEDNKHDDHELYFHGLYQNGKPLLFCKQHHIEHLQKQKQKHFYVALCSFVGLLAAFFLCILFWAVFSLYFIFG